MKRDAHFLPTLETTPFKVIIKNLTVQIEFSWSSDTKVYEREHRPHIRMHQVGSVPVTIGYTHGSNASTVNRNWGPPSSETNGDYFIKPNRRRRLGELIPPLKGQSPHAGVFEPTPLIPVNIQLKPTVPYVNKRTEIRGWKPIGWIMPAVPYGRPNLLTMRIQGFRDNVTLSASHDAEVEKQYVKALKAGEEEKAEALRRQAFGGFGEKLDDIAKHHQEELRRHLKLPVGAKLPSDVKRVVPRIIKRPGVVRKPGVSTPAPTTPHSFGLRTLERMKSDLERALPLIKERKFKIEEEGIDVDGNVHPQYIPPELRAFLDGPGRITPAVLDTIKANMKVDPSVFKQVGIRPPRSKTGDLNAVLAGKNPGLLRLNAGLYILITVLLSNAYSNIYERWRYADDSPERKRWVSIADKFGDTGKLFEGMFHSLLQAINAQGGVTYDLIDYLSAVWASNATTGGVLKTVYQYMGIDPDYQWPIEDNRDPYYRDAKIPSTKQEEPSPETPSPETARPFPIVEDEEEEEKDERKTYVTPHEYTNEKVDYQVPHHTEVADAVAQPVSSKPDGLVGTGRSDATTSVPFVNAVYFKKTDPPPKVAIRARQPAPGTIDVNTKRQKFVDPVSIEENTTAARQSQPAASTSFHRDSVAESKEDMDSLVDSQEPDKGQALPEAGYRHFGRPHHYMGQVAPPGCYLTNKRRWVDQEGIDPKAQALLRSLEKPWTRGTKRERPFELNPVRSGKTTKADAEGQFKAVNWQTNEKLSPEELNLRGYQLINNMMIYSKRQVTPYMVIKVVGDINNYAKKHNLWPPLSPFILKKKGLLSYLNKSGWQYVLNGNQAYMMVESYVTAVVGEEDPDVMALIMKITNDVKGDGYLKWV